MAKRCECGNPAYGFDCTCAWTKKHPGDTTFLCEFCGMYMASRPRCNCCEPAEGEHFMEK
jgi:hypothetical protein